MFRSHVIRASGGFSERFVPLEDYELWLKILRLGATIVIPWNVLEYRVHPGQVPARDPESLLDAIRQDAVDRMEGKEREASLRILQARASLLSAQQVYAGGRFHRALQLYFTACRQAPAAVWSLVSGPTIVRHIVKSVAGLLLGRRLTLAVRNIASGVRGALDRRPKVSRGASQLR
jgi:hypothetical protein